MQYLSVFTSACRRHNVKPGLSGLAQINGEIQFHGIKKFRLDVLYVDNRGF